MFGVRPWALWRQFQYGFLFCVLWSIVFWFIYLNYFHVPSTCFDGELNGDEQGTDCGGSCVRICGFMVEKPNVLWAESFQVIGDQYNAVAYVENRNDIAASPEVEYIFELYDGEEMIAERRGKTVLPPDSEYPIFEGRINTGGRVPTRTILIIKEPELWQPATVGRDQFRVKERKLIDADGKPRLEAIIENKELFEAKEAEIVATIFDSQGNALTSSRTFIDNFAPRSEERVVFTWPGPIAKTVRSCEVPTDVVLAIDLSGSMNNDQPTPPQPITAVLQAAGSFTDRMQTNDQVGLVTFATEAQVTRTLTADKPFVKQTIGSLFIDPEEETGSTNTGDALYASLQELTSMRHSTEARKVLVILTDGLATAPDEEPELYALRAAQRVKDSGVTVYAIGLGEEVNMAFVRQVASTPSHAYQAISRAEIDSVYQTITADICEDGAAVIDIVPKTTASFEPLQ